MASPSVAGSVRYSVRMADRYFVPEPPNAGLLVLTGAEAHHLARVSRLAAGSAVTLFCGDGLDYPAVVASVGKGEAELQVAAPTPNRREWPARLLVAAPLPKGDRGGFLIEKLTELGAAAYVPLLTRRTVVAPGEAKADKLRRAVIEASKQCGRSVLMQVEPPQPLAAFLARGDLPAERRLADPQGAPWRPMGLAKDTAILVGPEGGLTEEERAAALAAGFSAVSLGPRILRVETAALALTALRTAEGAQAAG